MDAKTAEYLQWVRNRAAKATHGPWKKGQQGVCECPLCHGEGEVDFTDINGDGWVALAQTYGIGEMVRNNEDFIINARADIPKLLAIIEQQAKDAELLQSVRNGVERCSAMAKACYVRTCSGRKLCDKYKRAEGDGR